MCGIQKIRYGDVYHNPESVLEWKPIKSCSFMMAQVLQRRSKEWGRRISHRAHVHEQKWGQCQRMLDVLKLDWRLSVRVIATYVGIYNCAHNHYRVFSDEKNLHQACSESFDINWMTNPCTCLQWCMLQTV